MRRLLLAVAAVITCALALPAAAQPARIRDNYLEGDWWLVTPSENGSNALLAEGMPFKHPNNETAVSLVLLYATPDADRKIGVAVYATFDCVAKTVSIVTPFELYEDGKMGTIMSAYSKPGPLDPTSALYRAGCDDARTGLRHFSSRSRADVVAEIFGNRSGE
jgi:hypothetical protein